MNPSKKSKQLNEILDNVSKNLFGREREESIRKNICVMCGNIVDENNFKDELSLKEFKISGMCQECQDKIF